MSSEAQEIILFHKTAAILQTHTFFIRIIPCSFRVLKNSKKFENFILKI